MQKISIILPVYNAEDCLKDFFEELLDIAGTLTIAVEYVFVCDNSPDNSLKLLKTITSNHKGVVLVENPQTMGQHMSLKKGLEFATGDCFVFMDCDGQDDPKILPKLLEKLTQEHLDAVIVKWTNYTNGNFRYVFSRLFYAYRQFRGKPNNNPQLGIFRIFNPQLRNEILLRFEKGMLYRDLFLPSKFNIDTLSGVRRKRFGGSSSYNLKTLLSAALKIKMRTEQGKS